ncbi:Fic family protein [Lachnobacterium bovis]|uniref:Fic family protein n=1 Tax=Lachnobacterium bovis TaxID=140626 RepID=UPI00048D0737|nr:Fic family protein [Lachnobacterium bovis]
MDLNDNIKQEYKSVTQIAQEWKITTRAVRNYCQEGMIPGVQKIGKMWLIPENARKPIRMESKRKKKGLLKALEIEMKKGIDDGIYHGFVIDATFNTFKLEGGKLSREQVRYMHDDKSLSLGGNILDVDEIIEMSNHFRCLDFIIKTAKKDLDEKYIKKLFFMLENSTDVIENFTSKNSCYKKSENKFNEIETVKPENVEKEIKILLDEYNSKENVELDDVLYLLHRFMMISPFSISNGKIARLIVLKECLKNRIVPFLIEEDMSVFYLRGIEKWKEEPSILKNITLVAQEKFSSYLEYFGIKYNNI